MLTFRRGYCYTSVFKALKSYKESQAQSHLHEYVKDEQGLKETKKGIDYRTINKNSKGVFRFREFLFQEKVEQNYIAPLNRKGFSMFSRAAAAGQMDPSGHEGHQHRHWPRQNRRDQPGHHCQLRACPERGVPRILQANGQAALQLHPGIVNRQGEQDDSLGVLTLRRSAQVRELIETYSSINHLSLRDMLRKIRFSCLVLARMPSTMFRYRIWKDASLLIMVEISLISLPH